MQEIKSPQLYMERKLRRQTFLQPDMRIDMARSPGHQFLQAGRSPQPHVIANVVQQPPDAGHTSVWPQL